MTTKLSKEAAKVELNKLERSYYDTNVHLKEFTSAREDIRNKILHIFDFLFGKQAEVEFSADSGMTLQKSIAVTESWNEKTLETNLSRDKWLAITVERRVIDEFKLAIALQSGKVTMDDLAVGKEIKETVRLNHKAPSKNGGK